MRQATAKTLGHLLEAMDAQRAVTIRYAKPVRGGVEITRRRIEIHSIEVDGKGDTLVHCHDHRSNTRHTFRLDRITHYTLHHRANPVAAYTAPVVPNRADLFDNENMLVVCSAWSLASDTQPTALAA